MYIKVYHIYIIQNCIVQATEVVWRLKTTRMSSCHYMLIVRSTNKEWSETAWVSVSSMGTNINGEHHTKSSRGDDREKVQHICMYIYLAINKMEFIE